MVTMANQSRCKQHSELKTRENACDNWFNFIASFLTNNSV